MSIPSPKDDHLVIYDNSRMTKSVQRVTEAISDYKLPFVVFI